MVEKNGCVLFHSGPFSQWHPSRFEVDRVEYNCCEQFMMAGKARLFGDTNALQRIMSTNNPAHQKAAGREVKNFDDRKWKKHCREIVYQGNLAKFMQNVDLRDILLATGDKTIAEASPNDRIWGIGLSARDAGATNPRMWRGTNWLGEAIMRVRAKIRAR